MATRSEARIKVWENPEFRERMKEIARKRQKLMWQDPEYRQKTTESFKGNTNRRGKTASEETLRKSSLAHMGQVSANKGKKMSEEQKRKISLNRRGKTAKENNPNWKGGTYGTERHREMGKWEYKVWRDAVFKRDNYTCLFCLQYGGIIHADHIKSWSNYPEMRYNVDNGRTLCRACHFYVTFKIKMRPNSKWGLANVAKKRG